MTYVRPTFRHPDLPKNKINFTKKDYEGALSTLCAGCGHDSISAGIIQAGTALTRATSTATTAGVANPIVATVEHILAIVGSIFSIVIPFVIAGVVCVLILVMLFFVIITNIRN